jgi:hypothetical protein
MVICKVSVLGKYKCGDFLAAMNKKFVTPFPNHLSLILVLLLFTYY